MHLSLSHYRFTLDMERLKGKQLAAKKAATLKNRFADFAYKNKKIPSVPFGLETTTAPLLKEILAEDSSLASSVTGLMSQVKAEGTIVCYEQATKKFRTFCQEKNYEYPTFSEKAVLHYIIQQDKDKTHLAALGQIRPALVLVEKLAGTQHSAFTETADIMLSAAKRRAAEIKLPVKKAGELPDDILHTLYPLCFLPFLNGSKTADPVLLRTYVRDVVIYFTFCRFNCYSRLRAMDVEDDGQNLQITFTSAKNDQYHNGRTTCLVGNDSVVNPVNIVRSYFKLCKFKFGRENGDTSRLNCVIRRKKCGWTADGSRKISYSTATKNLQNMLEIVGVSGERMTDKSFKMLGVTRTLNAGVATDDVAHQGRWVTASMPLHYKHNSVQFKEKMSSQVPA